MKYFTCLHAIIILFIASCTQQKAYLSKTKAKKAPILLESKHDLSKNYNKRVFIVAKYFDPGKGSRYLDCGFIKLNIADYSFYSKDKNGYLTTTLENGDKIKVEVDLNYFPGSKSLVSTHPIRQEALPPKKIIDGKEYYVYPPSYSISNGKLLEKIKGP